MTIEKLIARSGLGYTESVLIVSSVLNVDKAEVIAHPKREIDPKVELRCYELFVRALAGEPMAYIFGVREFYGRDFKVNQNVLIPRPETEEIVDIALGIMRKRTDRNIAVAELGTGSGALIITLAKEFVAQRADIDWVLVATDISSQALTVAKNNAKTHGVLNLIEWRLGKMFEPFIVGEKFDLIVANLPYLPTQEAVHNRYEPQTALDGGVNGDELITEMLASVDGYLATNGMLVYEGYGGVIKSVSKTELVEKCI